MNGIRILQLAAADEGLGEIVRILDGVRNFLIAILTALAILAMTYAGIRYVMAAGDPAGVERAKTAARSAVVGLALALLAPVLVSIVKRIIGV